MINLLLQYLILQQKHVIFQFPRSVNQRQQIKTPLLNQTKMNHSVLHAALVNLIIQYLRILKWNGKMMFQLRQAHHV